MSTHSKNNTLGCGVGRGETNEMIALSSVAGTGLVERRPGGMFDSFHFGVIIFSMGYCVSYYLGAVLFRGMFPDG